jgi:hypothetical protein
LIISDGDMVKRGQYAFEFFMSYGWAVAAAIIALGGLAYFSLFDAHNFLPDTCILGPGLTCVDPIYQPGPIGPGFAIGVIGFDVINNLGKDLVDFYVVVDPKHTECGGWTAMITSSNLAAITTQDHNGTRVFKNGERREIIFLQKDGSVYQPAGYLACFPVFNATSWPVPTTLDINCCDADLPKTMYNPPNGLCPGETFNNTVCKTGVNMIDVDRFETDLWIFYREKGSSILHKRVGSFNVGESGCFFVNCPGCFSTCP